MKRRLVLIAAALAAGYALPYRLAAYPMQVADIAIIFALLAIGLHLTLGIAGQINLAQVAFFGELLLDCLVVILRLSGLGARVHGLDQRLFLRILHIRPALIFGFG